MKSFFKRLRIKNLISLPYYDSYYLLKDYLIGRLPIISVVGKISAYLYIIVCLASLLYCYQSGENNGCIDYFLFFVLIGFLLYFSLFERLKTAGNYPGNTVQRIDINKFTGALISKKITVQKYGINYIELFDGHKVKDKAEQFVLLSFVRNSYAEKFHEYVCNRDFSPHISFICFDLSGRQVLVKSDVFLQEVDTSFNHDPSKEMTECIRQLARYFHSKNITNIFPILFNHNDNYLCIPAGEFLHYSSRTPSFFTNKNKDLEEINKVYSTSLVVKNDVRSELQAQRNKYSFLYSTAYFSDGIGFGMPWARTHGYGRWIYILRDAIVPIIHGKKILDLGSNTGILPIYMLRAGAKKVTAIEMDPLNIETMHKYHSTIEWMDDRDYDLKTVNDDMRCVFKGNDFDDVDIVTLYCSIYYLEESEIKLMMKWVYVKVGIMIVESNEESLIDGRKHKAKIEYLKKIASDVGFSDISVIAPKGYHRPLFIARNVP